MHPIPPALQLLQVTAGAARCCMAAGVVAFLKGRSFKLVTAAGGEPSAADGSDVAAVVRAPTRAGSAVRLPCGRPLSPTRLTPSTPLSICAEPFDS
jgi:hypothetical protein